MKITGSNAIRKNNSSKTKRKAFGEVLNKRLVSDIDKIESDLKEDLRMINEYVEDILRKYKEDEYKYLPIPNYMNFQEELRWGMRTVLVDWIINVHHKLNLLSETLYLAVNLIDRFLSVRLVSMGKLQLVGVSGLLVASKFQEIASPSIETFVVLTDRSFTENEILRAEKFMLHCVEYNLGYPSPLNWLRRVSYAKEIDRIGTIILDLLLLDETFLKYTPSLLGTSAGYIARAITTDEKYEIFYHYSCYTLPELSSCIEEIRTYLSKPILHSSIFKKHGSSFTKYLDSLSKIELI
ncbi:G2/mitotic-specific cyclin 2 [Nematocida sp. AWRm80]|nr:G2/mitotic-specific cyclin 2 [Nematocida sp. AWRm80]